MSVDERDGLRTASTLQFLRATSRGIVRGGRYMGDTPGMRLGLTAVCAFRSSFFCPFPFPCWFSLSRGESESAKVQREYTRGQSSPSRGIKKCLGVFGATFIQVFLFRSAELPSVQDLHRAGGLRGSRATGFYMPGCFCVCPFFRGLANVEGLVGCLLDAFCKALLSLPSCLRRSLTCSRLRVDAWIALWYCCCIEAPQVICLLSVFSVLVCF